MNILILCRHQIRLLSRSPGILFALFMAPVLMIYLFGMVFASLINDPKSGLGAIDYFGSTLLSLGVLQGTFIASWGIGKEERTGAKLRLSIAPLSPENAILGTLLGTWIILFSLSSLVYLACRFFLSAQYALPLPLVLAVIGAESFLACALGIGLSTLAGSEKKASPLLSTMVPLLCFLGGSYTMIPPDGILHELAPISPVRWVNLALLPDTLRAITAGANVMPAQQYLLPVMISCLVPGAIILSVALLIPRRQQ